MKITILGGGGFIGSHLRRRLSASGLDVDCPPRDTRLVGENLGVLVYCVGLTADFRKRPGECYAAHVGVLEQVLADNVCDRAIYLSSTRLYQHWARPVASGAVVSTPLNEAESIPVSPGAATDVYTISKLAGESLVLATGADNIVLRLSNVVGPAVAMESFLGHLVEEIGRNGRLYLQSHAKSEKDYISVGAVTWVIEQVLKGAAGGIYNLCNGYNLSHQQWLDHLAGSLDFELLIDDDAPGLIYPPIANSKLVHATGFEPETPQQVLAALTH